MKVEEIHIFVRGCVQGVGFRYSTLRKAQSLGIGGWVRNTDDGKVEITAHGESTLIETFLRWCNEGPRGATVEAVELVKRKTIEASVLKSFEIRYD
ncbi:MAG: acylphosphatase [Deltaproteobacteria bacterium]|nr:acylphosphatase [Deltaproteobacteria bacterium]